MIPNPRPETSAAGGWRSGLLLGTLGLLLALGLARLAVDVTAARADGGEGDIRTSAQGTCGDIDLVVAGDVQFCTHGPDPAPPGLDASEVVSAVVGAAEASGAVACEGDGVTGPRVEVIYAHAANVADRYAQYVESFRTWAGEADQIYRASAAETGGSRAIRFVTTAPAGGACEIVVRDVMLTATGDDTIMDTAREMNALGYDRTDRKYMIFMDATVICGQGGIVYDYRRDAGNANNFGPGYGRTDAGCWGGSVPAHELAHNLGAVQFNAPNSSFGSHCTDEYDRMCYSDGPNYPAMRFVCGDPAKELILDCNHDDYFSTDPLAGSFLDQFWNVASSRFLIGAVERPVMGAPANDDVAAAVRLEARSFADVRAVRAATAPGSDPVSSCQRSGGGRASVWYRTRPATDGTLAMNARSSDFDTMITVFTGTAADLTEVACNDDGPDGATAELSMPVRAGVSYWVMVNAGSDRSVPYTLHVAADGPAGAADGPVVTLDKVSSKFNGMVTATLAGYSPGEAVTLAWADGRSLGAATVDDAGAATIAFRTPLDVFGAHAVSATGGSGAAATGTLRVIPRTMLNEVAGPPTTRTRVYLYGFAAGERVEVRWHSGALVTSSYLVVKTLTVADNGRASSLIAIPSGAGLGSHLVVGKVVGVSRSATASFMLTSGAPSVAATATRTPTATQTATPTRTATPVVSTTATPEPPAAADSTGSLESTATETDATEPTATPIAEETTTSLPSETPEPTQEPTATAIATPTDVPNMAPTADAGRDATVIDGDGSGDEEMEVDGRGSADPEGGALTYVWTVDGVEVATGPTPTVALPVGATAIVLTVTDVQGATATDEVVISVAPSPVGDPPAEA